MEAGLRAELSPSSGGSTCWNISRLYKKRLLTGWTSSKGSLMVRQRVSGGWIYVLEFFIWWFVLWECFVYIIDNKSKLYLFQCLKTGWTARVSWSLQSHWTVCLNSSKASNSCWMNWERCSRSLWLVPHEGTRAYFTIITGLPRINTFLYRATKPKSLKNNRLRTMWNWTNCLLQSRWFWLWTVDTSPILLQRMWSRSFSSFVSPKGNLYQNTLKICLPKGLQDMSLSFNSAQHAMHQFLKIFTLSHKASQCHTCITRFFFFFREKVVCYSCLI